MQQIKKVSSIDLRLVIDFISKVVTSTEKNLTLDSLLDFPKERVQALEIIKVDIASFLLAIGQLYQKQILKEKGLI